LNCFYRSKTSPGVLVPPTLNFSVLILLPGGYGCWDSAGGSVSCRGYRRK